jgi:uncharacterized protein (DUF983 family)
MKFGILGRCPHCGEGALFRRFLKPVAECAGCREDLSHQRADDFPPYVTMVIAGHLLLPAVLAVQTAIDLTAVVTVALLQPVKGAIVALQWALRMHGFDGDPDPDRFDRLLDAERVADKPSRRLISIQ